MFKFDEKANPYKNRPESESEEQRAERMAYVGTGAFGFNFRVDTHTGELKIVDVVQGGSKQKV